MGRPAEIEGRSIPPKVKKKLLFIIYVIILLVES